tara:strand:+ start:2148 stop:3080 length:933 start_codon:yes stop_codon:yes gene_type:complete
MLRVRFSENANIVVTGENSVKNYFDLIDSQFLDIFLPSHKQYTIVPENEVADICILGTQHTNNLLLRDNELNIFFTVENFSVGRNHYQHFNKFGRFNNPLIKLYIYNDICIPRENTIPAMYQRIKYFNKLLDPNSKLYYNQVRENYNKLNTPFNMKKFCLFISQNNLNHNKQIVLNQLSKLGNIDFLHNLANKNLKLKTSTCFNSIELLKTFNQYKFVIAFENSNSQGYITEKIFNVFLAKSIPIYDGDPRISDVINTNSFLQYDDLIIQKVQMLMNNEELYNNIINKEKTKELDYTFINNNFDRLLKCY